METPTTEAFWWHDFVRHAGLGAADYQVVAFGDNLGIATELAALVVARTKRAYLSSLLSTAGDRARPPSRVPPGRANRPTRARAC
jgi:uncharacterized protein YhfF